VRAQAALDLTAQRLDLTAQRLDHGKRMGEHANDDASNDAIWGPLWALDRPTWELA
jgi:hypothetical protein